jgi:hypothetical protein
MRRQITFFLVSACFFVLFLLCYASLFLGDRQLGFRDAGHFYYPLHQRVQQEWQQGRWPLWEQEENAGFPLLGNPTAAVFYPGKLVFAVLPYPRAARIYAVGHTMLAFLAMLILMRSWSTSWVGSGLAALAYTFGVPILFQYCNIIYLVGAAWLPLGIRAVDRWVRLGRRLGLVELALVLVMQVLGGDLQTAYLLGLCGVGYAAGLAWTRARRNRAGTGSLPVGMHSSRNVPALAILGFVGCAVTLLLAMWFPKLREPHANPPTPPLPWMLWMPTAVNAAWGLLALGFIYRWRGLGWRTPLGAMWLGLASAAALAAALAAVQLLPIIEFTQQTSRAAGAGPHDVYPFSIEPYRMVEMAWPNVFGVPYYRNSYWAESLRIPGVYPKTWVPSLYMGGLTLVLGCCGLSLRKGPPWRVWLSAIVIVSVLGSLGKYTSPIWMARLLAATSGSQTLERLTAGLGPLDQADSLPIRQDGFLRDGDGGVYWYMATFLPGFRQFRFPAKLFGFTALALGALAGAGWDQLCAGRARRVLALAGILFVSSLAVFAGVVFCREPIVSAFRANPGTGTFGTFEAVKGFDAILGALAHAGIVAAAALSLTFLVRRRPWLAGALALVLLTIDLAAANPQYVLTVPQSLFETKPEVLRIIEDAERAQPSPGPYRIHRMPLWSPMGWSQASSRDRVHELVSWERDTLQPKYGITLGVEYTHTIGTAELYDYEWYFNGFMRKVHKPEVAESLGVELGKELVYFPRRGFDMWNTRYFVMPSYPNGWRDESRGIAAFLFQTERVYPEPGRFDGPGQANAYKEWVNTKDFRIERNNQAFPRAWVVHAARAVKPLVGLSRESYSSTMQEILYAEDLLWNDTTRVAFDPHRVAWMAEDDLSAVRPQLSGRAPSSNETVTVSYPTPQATVLDAHLESPGLVILCDVYYPGWVLTIDGQPATIYRTNGAMRGASVPAGTHRLVYTYAPQSFFVGGLISIAGIFALAVFGVVCARRPINQVLAASDQPDQEVLAAHLDRA